MSGGESYLKPSVGKCQVIDLSLSKQKFILPPKKVFFLPSQCLTSLKINFKWNREGYFSDKMSLFLMRLFLPKFNLTKPAYILKM